MMFHVLLDYTNRLIFCEVEDMLSPEESDTCVYEKSKVIVYPLCLYVFIDNSYTSNFIYFSNLQQD